MHRGKQWRQHVPDMHQLMWNKQVPPFHVHVVNCFFFFVTTCMSRFVSGPCTGLTGQDTQCSSCKTRCADDEYIKGTCSGTTLTDTTECTACTPRPSNLHYTKNPCNGRSREDQVSPHFCCMLLFLCATLTHIWSHGRHGSYPPEFAALDSTLSATPIQRMPSNAEHARQAARLVITCRVPALEPHTQTLFPVCHAPNVKQENTGPTLRHAMALPAWTLSHAGHAGTFALH